MCAHILTSALAPKLRERTQHCIPLVGVSWCVLSFWLQVWASCMPVTHSSKMTHLSSSQPHGLCFTTRLLSFTGGDERESFFRRWRWAAGHGEARVGNIVVYWTSTFSDVYSYSQTSQGLWFLYSAGVNSLFDTCNWKPKKWMDYTALTHLSILVVFLSQHEEACSRSASICNYISKSAAYCSPLLLAYWCIKVIYLKSSATIRKKQVELSRSHHHCPHLYVICRSPVRLIFPHGNFKLQCCPWASNRLLDVWSIHLMI